MGDVFEYVCFAGLRCLRLLMVLIMTESPLYLVVFEVSVEIVARIVLEVDDPSGNGYNEFANVNMETNSLS